MKTILITGATSGIGRACAEIFARNGYRLIITGRRKEKLDLVATELKEHYQAEVLALAFDVRNQKEVEENLSE
ncbi:MAG: SDR family NAD(P)-dependent oxidoreductase, partial [Chitinophagales bacterium]|nr:SDR family NAD(P)-dependent oxidoreductase [Chitinophagales bacterium]